MEVNFCNPERLFKAILLSINANPPIKVTLSKPVRLVKLSLLRISKSPPMKPSSRPDRLVRVFHPMERPPSIEVKPSNPSRLASALLYSIPRLPRWRSNYPTLSGWLKGNTPIFKTSDIKTSSYGSQNTQSA